MAAVGKALINLRKFEGAGLLASSAILSGFKSAIRESGGPCKPGSLQLSVVSYFETGDRLTYGAAATFGYELSSGSVVAQAPSFHRPPSAFSRSSRMGCPRLV